MIFAMISSLTWHMNAPDSNLTRLQAGDSRRVQLGIATLKKRAGEACNRHGCGLDDTVTK